MSDVILLDENGVEQTYSDVDTVLLNTTDGGTATYVSEHLIQNQVQADWDQTDDTQPDYIKNKPEAFASEPELPKVSEDDNGKVLGVANGIWQKITLSVSGEGGSIASVQADWEQTDSSQPDYIKNRPFYESPGEIDIFPLTRCENFTLDSSMGVSLYIYMADAGCILDVGENYKVSWDGVEYTCEALDVSSMYQGIPMVVMGNGTAFGMPGNNEPFIVTCNNENGYLTFICLQHAEPCSHDVRIYHEKTLVKTLDKKFLPIPYFGEENKVILSTTFEDYKYDSDGDGVEDTWANDMGIFDSSDSTIIIGETYTVVWNEVAYTAECIDLMAMPCIGNTVVIDGEDNGLPFAILRDVNGMMAGAPCWFAIPVVLSGDGIYTCTISGKQIKKIDSEYLYQPDWNVGNPASGSYIANKPFGKIPAGTVVANEVITVSEYALLNSLNGSYIVDGARYLVNLYGVSLEGMAYIEDDVKYIKVDYNGVLLATIACNYMGMYNVIMFNTSHSTYTSLIGQGQLIISLFEDIVSKIDPIYLPDGLGGGSSLPEVTTNNNGQVMTVVDGVWTAQTPASGLPDVTVDDNDKVLAVSNGVWTIQTVTHPVELPNVTVDDAGKFLRVGSDGTWIVETIQNVAEVGL